MFSRVYKFLLSRPLVLFLFIALFFSLEYIILGPASYVRVGDNLDSTVPRAVTIWKLANSQYSSWHPLLAGGVDRLTNEATYWSLISLIFGIFSPWLAYGIITVGSCFIGGYFTYLLCKEQLRLPASSSILAGALFIFSLIQVDILQFMVGLAILPWTLIQLDRIFLIKNADWRLFFNLFCVALIFSLASSFIFTLPFTLIAVFFWIIVIRKHKSIKILSLLLGWTLVACIPHIREFSSLSTLAPLSQRGGGYFGNGVDYYIGSMLGLFETQGFLLLALISIFLIAKNKHREYRYLTYFALIAFFVAPAYKIIAPFIGQYVRLLQDFSFDRLYLIFPFFATISVAMGTSLLTGQLTTHRYQYSLTRVAAVTLFVISICLNSTLKWNHLWGWYRNGSFLRQTYSPDVELIHKEQTPTDKFRVATISNDKTGLIPTHAHFSYLETIDGHANLTSKRYMEFFRLLAKDPSIKSSFYLFWQKTDEEKETAKKNIEPFVNNALLSLANVRYIFSEFPVASPSWSLISSDLPKYKSNLSRRFIENFHGKRLYTYENKEAFPRFFLVKETQLFDSTNKLLQAMENASTTTLRSVAFLDDSEAVRSLPILSGTSKNITIQKYSPDEIILTIASDGPSLLIITNNYNANWEATVNGVKVPVLPAYHTFMAIPIDTTKAEVVLRYAPPYTMFSAPKK